MYVYESHLGGFYASEDDLEWDSLYCEQCGDSDRQIGKYDTIQEFLQDNADEFDIDGSGGYDLEMVLGDLLELGEIELSEAEKIVRKYKNREDD